MTQQQAQRANFGPIWPEVAGFGEGTPQQAVFEVFPQGKISKTCKCLDTCPACRLAESPKRGTEEKRKKGIRHARVLFLCYNNIEVSI